MSRDLYLGVCIFAPKPFTRLRVLARAERGAWHVSDFSQTLPREGNAFAPSLIGWETGGNLAFRVLPNERRDADRDHYIVDDPERVAEVVDYRDRDPELARRALVEDGLESVLPGSDRVVVALPGRLCTVIRMGRDPQSRMFIAQAQALEHLPTFKFDERLFDGDKIDGRWITIPGVTIGAKTGSINWCPDADFLEWILKRLSKAGLGSPISRAQVPAVVRYLSDAELLSARGEDIAQSVVRFRQLANHLAANHAALERLVAILSALEPVQAALRAHREELRLRLRDELEPVVRSELVKGLGELAAHRAELTHEIERANADVAVAKDRAAQAHATAMAVEEELVDELARLGDALDITGEQAQPKFANLVTRITHRLAQAGQTVDLIPNPNPPWSRLGHVTGDASSWSDAGTILDRAAARWGYVASDMRLADIVARAGRLLLLPQNSARSFLRSYAWAIAGGELVVEGLHPAVIALEDLWRQPTGREPTGFARAWTAARLNPRRFRLVLLDGLQSTPHDLWAAGLEGLLSDAQRPANLLIFASIGPSFVDRERVWPRLAEAFVPFAPSSREGATPELLDRASGRTRAATWLDATTAPRPDALEFAVQLEQLGNVQDTERVAYNLAIFAAGRAIEDAEATQVTAARFLATQKPQPLERGDLWLREILTANDD